jgi:hypothetical protein
VQRLEAKHFGEHIEKWPAGLVQQVALKFKVQSKLMATNDFEVKLTEYLEAEDGA